MYNNTNPAELYSGTTWELIPSDKYIRTGSTALQTGGSNSVSIAKTNLPSIKLKVDSHSHTQPAHQHNILYGDASGASVRPSMWASNGNNKNRLTDSAGGENTGSSTPYTETLGSGTALSIQPSYITLKFWKRLT